MCRIVVNGQLFVTITININLPFVPFVFKILSSLTSIIVFEEWKINLMKLIDEYIVDTQDWLKQYNHSHRTRNETRWKNDLEITTRLSLLKYIANSKVYLHSIFYSNSSYVQLYQLESSLPMFFQHLFSVTWNSNGERFVNDFSHVKEFLVEKKRTISNEYTSFRPLSYRKTSAQQFPDEISATRVPFVLREVEPDLYNNVTRVRVTKRSPDPACYRYDHCRCHDYWSQSSRHTPTFRFFCLHFLDSLSGTRRSQRGFHLLPVTQLLLESSCA